MDREGDKPMARPYNPDQPTTRSFRVSEGAWEKAKRRAALEGTTMSAACGDLVEGYAEGYYTLPKKKIVRKFPTDANAGPGGN